MNNNSNENSTNSNNQGNFEGNNIQNNNLNEEQNFNTNKTQNENIQNNSLNETQSFNTTETQNQNTPNQEYIKYSQNPYFNNNTSDVKNTSTIRYIPYVPGTTLPPNASQPIFINGMWYYQVLEYGTIKKKKMATSVKVMLGIMIGLTVACIVTLIIWCSSLEVSDNRFNFSIPDDNNSFLDEFLDDFNLPKATEEPTLSSDKDTNNYANPNGPEIVLKDNNTNNGTTEKAYEKLSESVVSISVYEDGDTPSTESSIIEGTGIILSSDGYIITNSHVIDDDNNANVYITLKNDEVFKVVVVGNDERTDLAILKCDEANDWKPAEFANSDQLKVGQDVIALGSPGGKDYPNTLTRGVVSGLNRTLSGTAVSYIQTDAAINPGNSGGPLANLNGQVIGINTIKVVQTEYEGMGFAIPSIKVKEISDQLIKNGYIKGRPKLGVVSTEVSKSLGGEAGICITEIQDDSPLKDTKVKVGDIITKIDNKSITSFNELFNTLDGYNIGDKVTLTVYRADKNSKSKGDTFTIDVVLIGDE